MNFGRIFRGDCINVPPPPDSRCDDPAFALANPSICPARPRLIIKPGDALTCVLGSIQFQAFSVLNGVETKLTSGVVWKSSDMNIAIIGAGSGNCTGTGAGTATISAAYGEMSAVAVLDVMAADDDGSGGCCGSRHVGMMLLVDNSRSMSQTFGTGYSTRLDYAKAAATRWLQNIREDKDLVGLGSFNASEDPILKDLTDDSAAVSALVPTITQTQQKTAFYDACAAGIAALNASSADLKVLILISDGEDTSTGAANGYQGTSNPITLLSDFKSQGGIVVCVGCRSSGRGFAFLSLLSTGGFFLNGYPAVADSVLDYLSGLKGYTCAGNCVPEGDKYVPQSQLNYSNFINWDVIGGNVDLLGPGLFDFLPGNGLVVDLAGSLPPAYGTMRSKTTYALESGHLYRFAVELAGNQRIDATTFSARLRVYYMNGSAEVDLLNQLVVINDYLQDFQTYAFTFTAPADVDAYISIHEESVAAGEGLPSLAPYFGLLLNSVVFEDKTDLTTLLNDNFDNENLQYIPPRCGIATTYVPSAGYAVGYNCDGEGCLDEPPPEQLADPSALPDIESGFTPPTIYNSTKTACATCPAGTANNSPESALITAVSPSSTEPSASASESGHPAFFGFQGFEGSGWWSPRFTGFPQWLQYRFSSAQTAGRYSVLVLSKVTSPSGVDQLEVINWKLQGSTDGTNWVTLDIQSNQSYNGAGTVSTFFPIATPGSYTYYRLLFDADNGTNANVEVYGFQLYSASAQQICSTKSASSTVSQADADAQAYAAALADAQSQLNCQAVYNSTEQYTAKCVNSYGQDVTKSASASSFISQADADSKALALAKAAAEDELDCSGSNNTQKITINDNSSATPYPSVQFVSGKTGTITKVQVAIKGFAHTNPSDVRMMLRHPDGTTCMLMSGAGDSLSVGQFPESPIDILFDDTGAALTSAKITAGTYKPTQLGASGPMFAPAPANPYGATLSLFNGKDPNGAWTLWIEDAAFLNSGQCAGGFLLTITTA